MALDGAVQVSFESTRDAFKNLNAPEDFAQAEAALRAGQI
jgi:molybdopterin-guanine dinucleotide biosynthesis protein A